MKQPDSQSPSRQLTLFDSACIIVGIIIGAGIYEASPLVASNVGTPLALILIWTIGGAIALVGALCYAELATTYPKLLTFTTPIYWFFATMVGVSLFVLRYKDPDRERPHRVFLYPLTPILFCLSCLFVLWSSSVYALQNPSLAAKLAIGVLVVGAIVSLWSGARKEV